MSRRVLRIFLALLLCSAASNATRPHPCRRPCVSGARPMSCRYDFVLETYASMSTECAGCPFNLADCFNPGCVPAEGRKKALFLVNRQLPGPSIEVCKGDRIIVDLSNELMIETTTIHWHGMHQKRTPFMDGVPYLTQCPIPPSGKFRYDFTVDTAGTYLWHSHSNEQRGEGMFGSLIVREPPEDDPSRRLYDKDEHVVVMTDWTRTLGIEGYALEVFANKNSLPHTILINGLGRFQPIVSDNGTTGRMPIAIFEVEKGLRYRFRLINAGVQDCPLEVNIDNHTLTVISSDGRDIEPIKVDSVRILSGERYDVIVSADQEVDNFWFRVRGREGSECTCDRTKAYQTAVLRYKGAPEREPELEIGWHLPPVNDGRQLNPYNKGQETATALSIPVLDFIGDDDATSHAPDHTFYLSYDYVNLDERKRIVKKVEKPNLNSLKTLWQINHINMKMPNFPPLTQPELIEPGTFCNAETAGDCNNNYCSCPHVLSAKLNSVVELIFVDEGKKKFNHPMHLHGNTFRVVAMEKIGNTTTVEEVKRLDREGKIKRKLSKAPFKDTIIVPSGGYTIVRFVADNPGYWILHCHFELHSDLGMAVVFKVGKHEDFVKPPSNFPKCGLYKPNFRR